MTAGTDLLERSHPIRFAAMTHRHAGIVTQLHFHLRLGRQRVMSDKAGMVLPRINSELATMRELRPNFAGKRRGCI